MKFIDVLIVIGLMGIALVSGLFVGFFMGRDHCVPCDEETPVERLLVNREENKCPECEECLPEYFVEPCPFLCECPEITTEQLSKLQACEETIPVLRQQMEALRMMIEREL